jgi:hypothetical protein
VVSLELDVRVLWMSAAIIPFLVGILVGRSAAIARDRHAVRQRLCVYEPRVADRYLFVDWACPARGCGKALLDCHHDEAHAVKSEAERLLERGDHPDSIRALLARSTQRQGVLSAVALGTVEPKPPVDDRKEPKALASPTIPKGREP